MALLSSFSGVPIIRFLAITKNDTALAFNSVIVATIAWRGKWSRHAVALSDNFFYAGDIFLFFAKNKNRLYPLLSSMRKFWKTLSRPFEQNNVGISKNWDTRGRLHKFAQGKTWVKFCLPALHFLMGRTKGKNGSFIAIRMRIHHNFFSSMTS